MTKVSIVRCFNYDHERVAAAVSRAVDLIGGMGSFVKKGEAALIKPNLLSARTPDEAVCTHPEFVRAVIRLVRKAGARPVVGDSPGNFFTTRDVDFVYEKTGIKRIAQEEGAGLVRFDKSRIIDGFPIAEAALDAPVMISLPKLKTHSLTVMTGAVKNSFGLIPGLFKVECHRNKPRPDDFARILVDIYQIKKPQLCIMDAVLSMEGDGPAAGNPKKTGLVLASSDAVSMDAVVSKLVGLPSDKDIIVNEARRKKAGEADMHNIEITGESIEDAAMKGFKLPKTAHRVNMLPGFIANIITRAIDFSPVIDEKWCKKCKVCKNSCPVDAITIEDKVSRINDRICVRCFCCHEVCPYKTIYIKRNFITKLLWRD
jgi:uncharacterized protein (DUF362 family)/Pyruvate/2-oxoacid:ferredoxin oxidoreductase delta subunit